MHGMYTKDVVVSHESMEEFLAFRRAFHAELPATARSIGAFASYQSRLLPAPSPCKPEPTQYKRYGVRT
jgi:hypothetical protein